MTNNYDGRKNHKEEQITKDRFISMSAKGFSKEDILIRLNISEELYVKWSRDLKDKISSKSDEISKAKKFRKSKKLNKKFGSFRKPLIAAIVIFILFSLFSGITGIKYSIKANAMSRCLKARAQLNFLTGQKLSLFPGGPVSMEKTDNTRENRDALTEELAVCESKGFTTEDTYISELLNTREGKGDRIVDTAGILSASDYRSIMEKLVKLEKEKGAQVVVVTTYTVKPMTIESFADLVFTSWKIGRKNVDDGVLFLIATEDRKMRIEVGYGLEGRITDLAAGRILSDYVKPYFSSGRMSEGINAGVDKIIAEINREELPKPVVKKSVLRFLDIKYFGPFCGITAIIIIFLFAIILNGKGLLGVLAIMLPGIFNYFFNIQIFHELAAVNFFLLFAFVILYWKKISFTGKDWTGNYKSRDDQYLYRNDYDSSSGGFSGDSGSSDSGFSGGGGESGGGGASDSW